MLDVFKTWLDGWPVVHKGLAFFGLRIERMATRGVSEVFYFSSGMSNSIYFVYLDILVNFRRIALLVFHIFYYVPIFFNSGAVQTANMPCPVIAQL